MYGSDARGYYEYLDWGIRGKNINYESGNSFKRGDQRILKYTYGTALYQLPFYLAANSSQNKEPGDYTYTRIDDVFISIGASVYIAFSLFLLYHLLGKFTPEGPAKILAVILVYFATNLFHYAAIESMMSHLYSFLSITGYIYFTLHFIDTKNRKHFLMSIVFLFLLIATRPFNVIIVAPILAYLCLQQKALKYGIISTGIILFAFFIQLVLWRQQCGVWTFASYDGEGFYWTRPQIMNVLFSFRKGLFVYSPLILIAVIGLVIRLFYKSKIDLLILSVCLIFTYAVSCWWHWPYGDSFGHRAFIDLYALPAVGLVTLINYCQKPMSKNILLTAFSLCIALNLFQTWQYGKFILAPEYMTYDKYKATLFRTNAEITSGLGGSKDIFPYKAKFTAVQDSIPSIMMANNEYSPGISFKNHPVNYKKCYIDVSFIKQEITPKQSFNARLLLQRVDTVSKEVVYFGACVNEGLNDFLIPNSKRYSYQFDISALKPTEVLSAFFTNPDHGNFSVKSLKVSLYYIH
jgi:hypothetical protein